MTQNGGTMDLTYHEGADGILYPDLKLGDYEKKNVG